MSACIVRQPAKQSKLATVRFLAAAATDNFPGATPAGPPGWDIFDSETRPARLRVDRTGRGDSFSVLKSQRAVRVNIEIMRA
jgi:hypothetical protein